MWNYNKVVYVSEGQFHQEQQSHTVVCNQFVKKAMAMTKLSCYILLLVYCVEWGSCWLWGDYLLLESNGSLTVSNVWLCNSCVGHTCWVCFLTVVPQVQQESNESDLPQRNQGGQLQLHAPALLECRLPDGGAKLSNPWSVFWLLPHNQ